MANFERELVTSVLEQNHFSLTRTAEQLKISRHALRYRMQRLNITTETESDEDTPPQAARKGPTMNQALRILADVDASRHPQCRARLPDLSAFDREPDHHRCALCGDRDRDPLGCSFTQKKQKRRRRYHHSQFPSTACRLNISESSSRGWFKRKRRRKRRRAASPDESHPGANRRPASRCATKNRPAAHCPDHAREPDDHPEKRLQSRAGFVLLPREKRDAMSALYAFCREVDDVADEESVPVAATPRTTGRLARGHPPRLRNEAPQFPVNRELQPFIERYHCRSSCSTNCSKAWRWIWTSNATPNYDAIGAILLPRRLGGGAVEHRDFWLSRPRLPRLRGLSGQGAATHQYSARRAHRRRTRADLSAAVRIGALQGARKRKFCAANIRTVFANLATEMAERAQAILSQGPRHAAARRTAVRWSRRN